MISNKMEAAFFMCAEPSAQAGQWTPHSAFQAAASAARWHCGLVNEQCSTPLRSQETKTKRHVSAEENLQRSRQFAREAAAMANRIALLRAQQFSATLRPETS